MNSPYDVIELATIYLKIYFIGMPFNLLYNFGSAIMRANGDTSRPLIYLFISGAANIIVNLFLVLVCNMSVDGVAIATILSQAVSACLVLSALAKYKEPWHLSLKHLTLDLKTLKGIVMIGLPAGIQGTLFSISNVLIQSSINSFGSFVMAGNGTASNLEGFVFVVMNAFYQAALSFIGQNLGAKKYYNIKKIYKYSIIYVISFSFTLGLLVFSLSPILTRLYSSDPDVIALATNRIAIMCLSYFLCGIMDVTVGTLRGLGHSIIPMITSIIGVCGFRVVWVLFIFSQNRNIGLLYASYPISWIITGVILICCFLVVYKKKFKPLEQNSN
jgi:putative MATE family efflux protein